MGRKPRVDIGGQVYHVCNRANLRAKILFDEDDYFMLQSAILHAYKSVPARILSFCLMPNHWHFVVWTRANGELGEFFGRLTSAHTRRWHLKHDTVGTGHLYQSRYRSFGIQTDERLLQVCKYVERNALTAGLCHRAQDWKHGSAFHRGRVSLLSCILAEEWPIAMPAGWSAFVNAPLAATQLASFRERNITGEPYGDDAWKGAMGYVRPAIGRPKIGRKSGACPQF